MNDTPVCWFRVDPDHRWIMKREIRAPDNQENPLEMLWTCQLRFDAKDLVRLWVSARAVALRHVFCTPPCLVLSFSGTVSAIRVAALSPLFVYVGLIPYASQEHMDFPFTLASLQKLLLSTRCP